MYPHLGSDSFLNFDLQPFSSFESLRGLYSLKTDIVRHEFDMSASTYGTLRLEEIIPRGEEEREKKRKLRLAELRKKKRQQQLCNTDSEEEAEI